MIVARSDNPENGVIMVGITDEDIAIMKQGITRDKHGNPTFGFRKLVCFYMPTNEDILNLLGITDKTIRDDDIKAFNG